MRGIELDNVGHMKAANGTQEKRKKHIQTFDSTCRLWIVGE
jgi:hypothetical protein